MVRRGMVVLSLIVVSALSACGSSGSSSSSPTTGSHAPTTYPAVLTTNFLSSCDTASHGRKAYCVCALTTLERTMPVASFESNGLAVEKGTAKLAPKIIAAEHSCLSKA